MNQISQEPKTSTCMKHPEMRVKLVKVNNLSDSDDNSLFHCKICFNEDLSSKRNDYLFISEIIKDGEKSIISKWPPLNDYSVLNKLKSFKSNREESYRVADQIQNFFADLKKDFLAKIDTCCKQMVERAIMLSNESESILENYQEISKISVLRELMIEDKMKDTTVQRDKCRQFISGFEQQREKNNELLSNLLERCNRNEQLLNNFEIPKEIKTSLFSIVDSIDFFGEENNQFNFTNYIKSLSKIEIEDIVNLIEKRRMLIGDDQYNSSETKEFKVKAQNHLNSFENIKEIFRKYPIFDLAKKIEIQQLQQVKLTKTSFNNGINRTDIYEDNQFSIKTNDDWINCVSDIILEKEKKYIFRFQIKAEDFTYFMVGLTQNSNCNLKHGYKDDLSCNFQYNNNQISYLRGYGISQQKNGDTLRLSKENEIEMRVWLRGQQLEIRDYPHYQHQIGLEDQYKNKLTEYNDLKLYLGIFQKDIRIILKSVEIVNNFPNS